MGIYFLIAIAFSAITAAHEVQGARPRLAYVQRVRAERRVIRGVRKSRGGQAPSPVWIGEAPVLQRFTIVCTAPRAPAFGC
jgi:hypothetical protein